MVPQRQKSMEVYKAAGKTLQFRLLLWKNFMIQKRAVIRTLLEIGLPTLFALLLIAIRQITHGSTITNITAWPACDITQLPSGLEHPHKMAFSPNNNATRRTMSLVEQLLGLEPFVGFSSEKDLVNFLMFDNGTVNNTKLYLGGIVFTSPFKGKGDEFSNKIEFKIRLSSSPRNAGSQKYHLNPFKSDTRWKTKANYPVFQTVGPREKTEMCGGDPGYYREGFLAIQNAISFALFEQLASNETKYRINETTMDVRRYPYPPYNDDSFVLVIQKQFPLILMLSFIVIALSIVRDIVHEKERKLKESMKMMGMSNWLHWVAWFIKYFLFCLISITLMTIFFSIDVGPKHNNVIGNTSPFVLFLFLIIYAISAISFCFAVSVFFSKANSAAAAGGILFFCSYIPFFFLSLRYDLMSWPEKMVSCIDFNVAMAMGSQVIGMFEGIGSGVQFYNLASGVSVDDNFSLLHVFIMLLVDSVFYCMIAWYIEAVFPGEYGVPQPWYFPFMASYWCGTKQDDYEGDNELLGLGQNPEYFEKKPNGIKPGIAIRNLCKEFGRAENKKKAVAGMTLDMYEGQITALLGHNGAGKTTTMSMLTGFIPPTSGTARVNGYDIRQDITSVRTSLGLCPQHDILFDSLTVEEHLQFFARLKGVPSHKLTAEVDAMLMNIGLMPKRKAQSQTLSGGMKRKLSVGIALIGGSKVVILDEPTSGMDPDARRHIWTVLQNNRAGRTMVLTTHFMDEADLLGDRIAIMADGIVKCCGSSLFLKNKYGAGYHMVIVKEPNCNVNMITNVVKRYVPEAELESNIGAELSYILPHESSQNFEALFTQLQSDQQALGISSFGASITTMEEVFLRVGESSDAHLRERLQNKSPPTVVDDTSNIAFNMESDIPVSINTHLDLTRELRRNSGVLLFVQQFFAMFWKRLLHTFRNKLVTLSQLIVPLFFTIMALIVIKTFPGPTDSPALKLSIDQFAKNYVPYASSLNPDSDLKEFIDFYIRQFDHSSSVLTYINNVTDYRSDPDMIEYLGKKGEEGIGNYNLKYVIAAAFDTDNVSQTNATAYFQNQAYHSPGIALSTLASAMLQYVTNDTSYSIGVTNHPLPRTEMNKVNDEITEGTTGFTLAFNVCFGMAFLASSFVLFLVKERTVKAKHIQFVSGVHAFNFWSATFFWDMINYMIPCICLIATFAAFNIQPYIMDSHWLDLLLLFVLYGWAMLPFMYLFSYIYSVPSTGYVWTSMFNILTGVVTILLVGILDIPELNLQYVSRPLEWIFLTVLPNFCLGQGLEDFYSNYEFLTMCKKYEFICHFLRPGQTFPCCRNKCGNLCLDYNENYLGWEANGIGRMLVFLSIQGCVYFFLLFAIELDWFKYLYYRVRSLGYSRRRRSFLLRQFSNSDSRVQEDSDVATERARLANTTLAKLFHTDKLLLKEVVKEYDTIRAVDHLSVGIPQGECFGLLGVNGAGKTTTFKMLTGDEVLTGGDAFLDGYSVKLQGRKVQQRLGYCPQFDALIDQLTGRETLTLFARLRGVIESEIPHAINNLIDALTLTEHADKLVNAYSGGNKRKLSTAIALVGNPPIIFLDEPTTGMDPVARRLLWDALATVRDSGRTLILTSHSMEECEALCTRLAIMVNGQFRCLGSPQHLKNKFGEGYTLMVKVMWPEGDLEPDLEPLRAFIEDQFPGSILKDIHQSMLHYHITDTRFTWAQLFGTMERAKVIYHIEDYLVGQTTLEQVFINFARSQKQPIETKTGCLSCCC